MRTCVTTSVLPLTLAALVLAGCGETGGARTSFALAAAGTAPSSQRVGDWDVVVDVATLAYGPVYLCSSVNAGLENCATAAAEHLGATSFDALAPEPSPMGTMDALTGVTVLSAMWDYGRTWRLPDAAPRALEGAVEGEHSAILEIAATRRADGAVRRYRFVLDVDGGSQPSGTLTVRARLPEHVVDGTERGLVVRFDPSLWASMVDFDALATLPEESPGELLEVPSDHAASSALTTALTTTALPTYEWQSAD